MINLLWKFQWLEIRSFRRMHSEILLIAQIFSIKFWFFAFLDLLNFCISEIIFHFPETVFFDLFNDFSSVINPLVGQIGIESHIKLRREFFARVWVKTFNRFWAGHGALFVALLNFLRTQLCGGLSFMPFRDIKLPGGFLLCFVVEITLHGGLFVVIAFVKFLGVIFKF